MNYTEAKQRLEKELAVIDQLNFCAYFLITWDIVQYSNKMGFMHVGRGVELTLLLVTVSVLPLSVRWNLTYILSDF